jgi:hypothetical protein
MLEILSALSHKPSLVAAHLGVHVQKVNKIRSGRDRGMRTAAAPLTGLQTATLTVVTWP